MKILLEFLLGKLKDSVDNKDKRRFEDLRNSCEDCFEDEYVSNNPEFDKFRDRYKSILAQAKGLYT